MFTKQRAFAVDSDALTLEYLPGPWLTKIFLISSIFKSFLCKKSKISIESLSKFSLLLVNSMLYDLILLMIKKTILSVVASIIKLFIFIFLLNTNVKADNIKSYANDKGIVSIMYHRFNESKYPSTNINMDVFIKHIDEINKAGINFINPEDFKNNFSKYKNEKKILLTIDDAFSSFYKYAWPFLKKNKIPFILFVSTEPVGRPGYMNWEQIKEVANGEFAYLGNHSHSHEYLIEYKFKDFKKDIDKSVKIFKEKIGYNPIFFSYPFGEYSLDQKKYISNKFEFAFGQHSGVIDLNKDKYELPRFPINEKYGDLERFKFIINLLPFQYKKVFPEEKMIDNNNPPQMKVEFFKEQKIENINCFSNEGAGWDNSKIVIKENILKIIFRDKFNSRRGRVNCSIKDIEGWRWFGIQFVLKNIKEN